MEPHEVEKPTDVPEPLAKPFPYRRISKHQASRRKYRFANVKAKRKAANKSRKVNRGKK